MSLVIIVSILFLAFANGANDNFKGVATLFGSATTTFNRALLWATVTTLLGSLAALILAQELLSTFSGKGLVPDSVIADPIFAAAVGFGAAATVFLATRLGFPISTTHALTGALVGAGLAISPAGVTFTKLGSAFVLPLILSPVISIALASLIYPIARAVRVKCGISSRSCLCVGTEVVAMLPMAHRPGDAIPLSALAVIPIVHAGVSPECRMLYSGSVLGIEARPILDVLHYISSGLVGFARGLNDTPKIVALLLLSQVLSPKFGFILVAFAIAIGGLISAKRVAETMSHKITSMNAGQGFIANSVTAFLVVFASRLGIPVSTTHVSCGALFGIGLTTGKAHLRMIMNILLAWITTLPAAMLMSALTVVTMRLVN